MNVPKWKLSLCLPWYAQSIHKVGNISVCQYVFAVCVLCEYEKYMYNQALQYSVPATPFVLWMLTWREGKGNNISLGNKSIITISNINQKIDHDWQREWNPKTAFKAYPPKDIQTRIDDLKYIIQLEYIVRFVWLVDFWLNVSPAGQLQDLTSLHEHSWIGCLSAGGKKASNIPAKELLSYTNDPIFLVTKQVWG